MITLKESVLGSLDGADNPEIFPYLPFLLQDLWEMGTDPYQVSTMVRKSFHKKGLKILDLACGKGAVSVKLARDMDCVVTGIDAVPDFIIEARNFATQYLVHKKCCFKVDDIRKFPLEEKQWDVIILGSIGNILGDLYQTLLHLKKSLKKDGGVILGDAYLRDGKLTDYNKALGKKEFFMQIKKAGFSIKHEEIIKPPKPLSSEMFLNTLSKRVDELISQEPQKETLFKAYLQSQKYETSMLQETLVCGYWLLKP